MLSAPIRKTKKKTKNMSTFGCVLLNHVKTVVFFTDLYEIYHEGSLCPELICSLLFIPENVFGISEVT